MIKEFQGKYRWLSNFWPVEGGIILDGITYPTIEHAYQAAKTLDPNERRLIARCSTPGQAKRAGKSITMRSDWHQVKLQVMEDLVRQKFTNDPELRKKLIQTKNKPIQEGNRWGDTFWGVCRGKGHNHLGKIIMKVRSELNE
jgi:ribA/ribD-fused uncharacterized protein